jgi:O-antigen/teichoic acid export membrane protein
VVGLELSVSRKQRIFREAFGLGRALAVQGLVQVLTAGSGILIVRALSTGQYAYYTIGAAAITAMAALSNGGILDGMAALGARNLHDSARLGALTRAALSLRFLLALALALPILASTVWMLLRNGAPVQVIVPLVLSVGLVSLGELNYSVLHLIPWLHGRIEQLQTIELQGALARFLGCAVVPLLVPRADLAVLCAASAFALQVWLLRRDLAPEPPSADSRLEPQFRRDILAVLRQQWLNDLNGLAQSQVSLWLLTAFASATDVAAFGALGRITVVFTVILQALHRTLLSRYAVLQDRRRAIHLYAVVVLVFVAVAASPLVLFLEAPKWVLRIFGPNYLELTGEFRLVCINVMLATLATLTSWLNTTRAWIMPSTFRILYQTGFLLLFVTVFGATTLTGVLLAGIGVNLMLVLANIGYSLARFRQMADIV